jgi:type IV secretion system protein VirB6
MNSWQFFAYIFDNFDVQFLAAVQQMATALVNYVRAPLTAGIMLWIAGMSAIELYHPGSEPLMGLFRKVIRAGLVLAMVGAANYTALFGTFALTTLPNEITAAITGAASGGALTPAAFDQMLGGGWAGLVQIWENLSNWSVKAMVIGMVAGAQFLVGAIFIAVGFVVFISSHIMLGLVIVVGPLFVCMLLWDKTVHLFNAWVAAILSLIVTQVLIVALLSLLLTTETNILNQITALNGAAGANANDVAGQMHYLVEATILFFMIGYLSPKIPQLAERLTGGAATGISAFSQMAHGAVASGAKAAGGGAAASGVKAAGGGLARAGAAGMRSLNPTGKGQ